MSAIKTPGGRRPGKSTVFLTSNNCVTRRRHYSTLTSTGFAARHAEDAERTRGSSRIRIFGHSGLGRVIVQYWRSFEHLEAFARAKDKKHWPAWVDFNRRVGASRSDMGIWHETYIVKPGQYEAVYSGMPPHGLGKVGRLVAATGKHEAARFRMTAGVPSSS